jgi:aryl-phospho-beta-D-glucosidase BglC (GH1 family)
MNAWQDHWITTSDLDVIQKYGCNVLRVPFSYRTLQDAAGNWKRDADGNIDFSRMDWIVTQAQRRGLYVIFDLHVWPGEYHVISRLTTQGDAARKQMAALWTQVARHYRAAGSIAGFDVINEPEGSPGNALQWTFYNAIRAEDPSRMLIFESVDYPAMAATNWTNVVWSAHYPEGSLQSGSVRDRLEEFNRKSQLIASPNGNVPIFIGETKAPEETAASANELASAFNHLGWSWCVWTYKGVDKGGWASMNYDRSLKYDLAIDSYDSILAKWTKGLSAWRSSSSETSLHPNSWWIDGFGRGFRARGG